YFLRVRRMKHVEATVDKLPQEARAQFLDESLRKYGIDASNATREQKLLLIKDEMDKRYRLSKLYAIALAIVFTICFALAVYVFIGGFPQPPNRNGGIRDQPTQSIVISNTRFGDLHFAPTTIVMNEYHAHGGSTELDEKIKKAEELVQSQDYQLALAIYEEL